MVDTKSRLLSMHYKYRVTLDLRGSQWDRLEAECKQRGIKGQELIEAVISRYLHTLPPLAISEAVPPPPVENFDADELLDVQTMEG